MTSTPKDPFAAGAARAAGERRRRQGTPLVSLAEGPPAGMPARPAVPAAPATTSAPAAAGSGSGSTTVAAAGPSTPSGPGARRPAPRTHRPVPRVTPVAPPTATTVDAVERSRRVRPVFDITAALSEASVTVLPTAARVQRPAAGGARAALATREPQSDSRAATSLLVEAPASVPAPAVPAAPGPGPSGKVAGSATPQPPADGAAGGEGGSGEVRRRPPRSAFSRPGSTRPSTLERPIAAPTAPPGAGRAPGERAAYRSSPRVPSPEITDSVLAAALTQQELTPDIEDVIAAIIAVLRTVASASGLGADEVEATVARMLAFIRRRLTGDYAVDDFGFDPDFVEHVTLPIMRMLYRQWFRVEVRGIENVPTTGSALIVANHSGTIALDAQMLQVAIHDEHPAQRNLRLLGADLVFKTPVMGAIARKQGATLAANPDAERLLTAGEVVGVFPEGFKGVGKPFSERYKLQRFGRGGFVSAAIRTGTPIIPCSIIGAEETYPLLGDIKLLARLLGAPYFPVTPTWPWLGPLGLLPLPSKWIMEFGEPVQTSGYGAAGADDPMLVFDLTDQVRETIQQTLYSLLMLRRSVFS